MVGAALFLLAILAFSSPFFLKNAGQQGFNDKHEVIVAVMGIALFGTMLLLAVYTWAAYYVEHFDINGTRLYVRSTFQNCQFDVSELKRLRWREYPRGGRIDFQLLGSKARLDLHGYSQNDSLRIIQALREIVPPQIQEGWPLFCYKVALPLRDGKSPLRNKPATVEPSAKTCLITRRRYDWMLVVTLPLSIAVAVVLWKRLDDWRLFTLPLLVIGGWALLRYKVPPEGRTAVQLTSTATGRAQLLAFCGIGAAQCALVGLRWMGIDKSLACWTFCLIILPVLPVVMYMLAKEEKRQKNAEQEAAKTAPIEWERGVT
jgi:hypothetical protein